MKRMHRMPFGAEIQRDGTARFRLWAPSAVRVEVEFATGAKTRRFPLAPLGDGWFEANTEAASGMRYAYRIDASSVVPDPASRSNPDGVHAPSALVDPHAYEWRDHAWRGRCWEDAVIYEVHVGTFTRTGSFAAAVERLEYLVGLGVTAIELMPLAAFPGTRNWGYDGVLPFAPAACYGTPDDLKTFIDEAHGRRLMVLLDVVYNHFGPEGNHLHAYAKDFFTERHRTPWGDAINFDGPRSRTVRDFFIHNALYWLEEFHFDGLRLDAVHAIADDSTPDIVTELCTTVRRRLAADRHVHVVLENDANTVTSLARSAGGPRLATAQWNDDFHHAAHVLATGERDGYYVDYAEKPLDAFGRALAEGFVYQGQPSAFRDGHARGSPSSALPPAAFIAFLQNHDQIGNRAFGERIVTLASREPLRAAIACMLLAPAPPMLFMGEEFGATTPFLFFCDYGGALAEAVTNGRRDEFGRFERFRDPMVRAAIPDPNAQSTFEASKLDWTAVEADAGRAWTACYRECIGARHRHIVPRLAETMHGGSFRVHRDALLNVRWTLGDGSRLDLVANFSPESLGDECERTAERVYATHADAGRHMPAYAVAVYLERAA